ncbi:adenylosuccinate synthase [Roseivirga pacifica]|uniref:adenylosuccinate synthase n=1 Tax=Roseivirga pacifica TaxID=1267423 RepID=UPI0020947424|nr:adenylosuccinate synthase [Roseivirga pacifica]MCO6358571.1 adenylosuccinate synthase [Roseivirga pacifica]MCO6365793.1 adenylosuccinate synthase [Roseivirga pacifica]MCO6371477.1 adenylosuccinate synthase [Roseivirga pacifica]MCO6376412.1 adenylosuccinate synthase [Roseivirga pacifica]MCO6378855.1 adenylosuccinate synthase [Roseivirga pacifica]
MKVDVLLGLQWGDEGKGKVVDYLAPKYNVVARFQGGPNAGHTLEFDGHKHVLHQIPSGIFRSQIKNIIGNGVVLDPVIFKKEIEGLAKFEIDFKENLFISKKTQLILPSHKLLDAAYEKAKGKDKIGSTLKGIGPSYQDKIARNGLRVGDILAPGFDQRYRNLVDKHESILKHHDFEYNLEEVEKPFFEAIEFLREFNLVNSEYVMNNSIQSKETILAEGAQGSLLDIDFGSYPYVTSSNTMTAGACTGMGIAPKNIGEVFGIFKAYCTRVGGGPFPTELFDDTGKAIQDEGREFGATTGRPRRCGWLDLPALKYAIMINGVSQLFMMKADVLSILEEIKVCTHYKLGDGTVTEEIPFQLMDEEITPVYKTFPGWKEDITAVKDFDSMPAELKDYIKFIEEQTGVPITIVSVGPDRTQTILR